jgi:hypothetical protein
MYSVGCVKKHQEFYCFLTRIANRNMDSKQVVDLCKQDLFSIHFNGWQS